MYLSIATRRQPRFFEQYVVGWNEREKLQKEIRAEIEDTVDYITHQNIVSGGEIFKLEYFRKKKPCASLPPQAYSLTLTDYGSIVDNHSILRLRLNRKEMLSSAGCLRSLKSLVLRESAFEDPLIVHLPRVYSWHWASCMTYLTEISHSLPSHLNSISVELRTTREERIQWRSISRRTRLSR